MEKRGKKPRFWLRISRAYRKAMIPMLCGIGCFLLILSIAGLWVHVVVTLAFYALGLCLAYVPRLLLRGIKSGYAEMLGADDTKIVLFGTMGHAQSGGQITQSMAQNAAALNQHLASETYELQGFWPTKIGRESEE